MPDYTVIKEMQKLMSIDPYMASIVTFWNALGGVVMLVADCVVISARD
jgi:hypothetical protein